MGCSDGAGDSNGSVSKLLGVFIHLDTVRINTANDVSIDMPARCLIKGFQGPVAS